MLVAWMKDVVSFNVRMHGDWEFRSWFSSTYRTLVSLLITPLEVTPTLTLGILWDHLQRAHHYKLSLLYGHSEWDRAFLSDEEPFRSFPGTSRQMLQNMRQAVAERPDQPEGQFWDCSRLYWTAQLLRHARKDGRTNLCWVPFPVLESNQYRAVNHGKDLARKWHPTRARVGLGAVYIRLGWNLQGRLKLRRADSSPFKQLLVSRRHGILDFNNVMVENNDSHLAAAASFILTFQLHPNTSTRRTRPLLCARDRSHRDKGWINLSSGMLLTRGRGPGRRSPVGEGERGSAMVLPPQGPGKMESRRKLDGARLRDLRSQDQVRRALVTSPEEYALL